MGNETRNIAKIETGKLIFEKGKQMKQIALVVKGTIRAVNDFMEYVIPSGNIIGILAGREGEYIFNYYAQNECMVYFIDFNDYDDLSVLSSAVKDYKELCELSAEFQFKKIMSAYDALNNLTIQTYEKIKVCYDRYKKMCETYSAKPIICKEIDDLEMQAFEKSDDYSGTEYLVKLMELPKDSHFLNRILKF